MRVLAAVLGLVVVVVACSSELRFPACERDDQCVVKNQHDYCVSGTCMYCRTSSDCADRERCRSGKCEVDPNAPLPRDAGADASDEDASDEEDASPPDEEESRSRSTPHVIPRGVRRFLRP
jgi:hypothetical protein